MNAPLVTPELRRAVNGCLGKCAYDTLELAEKVRLKRQAASGKQLRVYQCDAGPHWHLSSNVGRTRAQELCAVCLEPFEPTGSDDWAHPSCKEMKK